MLLDNVFISVPYSTVYVSVSFTIIRIIHEILTEYGVVITFVTTGTRGGPISTGVGIKHMYQLKVCCDHT